MVSFGLFSLSQPALGIIMLVLFLAFLMLGFPIAFTLMALGVIFGWFAQGDIVFATFINNVFKTMSNDVLLSIPLFLFMGYVIERRTSSTGCSTRSSSRSAGCGLAGRGHARDLRHLRHRDRHRRRRRDADGPARLPGDAAGRLRHEDRGGVVCAGGCLGILIPPSVMLILYGATAGVSVVKLYAAAFFPGLMLAGLYMGYVIVRRSWIPTIAPKLPPEERKVSGIVIAKSLAINFFPLFLLIAMVLGAIIRGPPRRRRRPPWVRRARWCWRSRTVSWARTPSASGTSGSRSTSPPAPRRWCAGFRGLGAVLGGVRAAGRQKLVEDFILSLNLNAIGFLILTQAIIFVLGWPLEWTEIIVIFLPIFLPLLDDFGVDPIFFGVLVALNLQTSFLSPPSAMAPFYLKGVAPST